MKKIDFKNKTVWFVILGFVLILGVVFWLSTRKKEEDKESTKESDVTNITNNYNTSSGFPLTVGSENENVRALQAKIIEQDPSLLSEFGIDGKYGAETATAVSQLWGVNIITAEQYNEIMG